MPHFPSGRSPEVLAKSACMLAASGHFTTSTSSTPASVLVQVAPVPTGTSRGRQSPYREVGRSIGLALVGVPWALEVAAGAALVAAFLNAVVGLCLGCELYLLLARARGTR